MVLLCVSVTTCESVHLFIACYYLHLLPCELSIYILCSFFLIGSFVFFLTICKSSSILHIYSLSSESQIFKYVFCSLSFLMESFAIENFIFTYPNISVFLHSFQSPSLCKKVSPFLYCTCSILDILASTFVISFFTLR